jgi:uncharacterized protein YydD (DUF2326 family)
VTVLLKAKLQISFELRKKLIYWRLLSDLSTAFRRVIGYLMANIAAQLSKIVTSDKNAQCDDGRLVVARLSSITVL